MSYGRAGASQTSKNTVAPIGSAAILLFAPQFQKVWMKKPSGHRKTPSWPSISSYGLHSAHPSNAISLVLRRVSTVTQNAKTT